MKKVLIPTKLDSIAKELLETNGNYTVVQDGKTDLMALAAQNPDTYALFVRSEKITAAVIDALSSLDLGYPVINAAQKKELAAAKKELLAE